MIIDIRNTLAKISEAATKYFAEAGGIITEKNEALGFFMDLQGYWEQLPEDLQQTAMHLIDKTLSASAEIAQASRSAVLLSSADDADIRHATKRMRAALRLRKYFYQEADVIHGEGNVYGFRPAAQSEDQEISPQKAQSEFKDGVQSLLDILDLLEKETALTTNPSQGNDSIDSKINQKYRPGTAFIMMWMEPKQTELVDVVDAVKSVFKRFQIKASRADDIEHEGLISERVLNEIRTSEFLFADLTGIRPNVYYEIGYAHALGKRVILYRKSGTDIHFDLAGYNCPEYDNLRDLREKLTKRLSDITNKQPKDDDAI